MTNNADVQEPLITASPEVKQIIENVLKWEKRRLEQKSKAHINDDIVKIIKEAVQ
ncbi:MAG TPA: hypothetical protein V6C58_17675 [Allocoleopsis sp.]